MKKKLKILLEAFTIINSITTPAHNHIRISAIVVEWSLVVDGDDIIVAIVVVVDAIEVVVVVARIVTRRIVAGSAGREGIEEVQLSACLTSGGLADWSFV